MTKYFSVLFFLVLIFQSNKLFAQDAELKKNIRRPKVGLVLSGGGAKGYAYIGLLKVLHEVNMPIDYIGGSSIGAIVGGMYAIGYHPNTIEKIIRNEDWDKIITNKLDRKYLALEERHFGEKHIFNMQIDDYKIGIGSSLLGSLNVDLMLNRFFSSVYYITDFNELDTPFLCIGTDLITGKAVVLNSGSLARAARASMAIPGYFPSIYYQGHHFIDGGVVNNYPAEQVKDLGANIIIGGDVQSKQITDIEELGSIAKVLDHIIGYQRIEANEKGKELTNTYIRFEMDYNMMDFTEFDSIIALGERVSMLYYDELKALADSLNAIEYSEPKELNSTPLDSIEIDIVELVGDESLQKKIARGYFDEKKGNAKTISEIEESIKYLSGTKSFSNVYYELCKEQDTNKLKVYYGDIGQGSLGIGLNYNDDYNGNILINATFRNLWNTRAKFFADLTIGTSPRLHALYIINNGIKPGIGVELDMFSFGYSTYDGNRKVNNWDFDNLKTAIFMPMTYENNKIFKLGFQYHYFRFLQDVGNKDSLVDVNDVFEHLGEAFVSIDIDSRDEAYFATDGSQFEMKGKYVFPFADYSSDNNLNMYLHLKYRSNFKLAKNFVFKPSIYGGISHQKSDSLHNQMYALGGQNQMNYMENIVPFTGLRFIEEFGRYAGVARAHFQYEFYKDFYATAMSDVGVIGTEWKQLIDNKILFGYGLKLSYESFIGPIELSMMGSNKNNGMTLFLNIGYYL